MEAATGSMFINEINTIPGFTSISMYPKMWEYSGLPMPRLLDRLIELALARHETRQKSPLHPRMILPLFFLFAAAPEQDLENSIRKLIDVLTTVQTQAADPVSTEQALYGGAIPGMLRRLDPHSVFFDPQQFEQLKQMERAESKGFGSIVSVLPGRVIVLQALPGTPSAKSGLSPGDEILAVNNVRLASLSFEQLVEFLGESRQHQAALTVRRPVTPGS